ncbi:MAG: DMT family transporter [Roseicyclus sp.]
MPATKAPTLVYFQLAAGMIIFGSATPVSRLVAEAMPVFLGAGLRVAIGGLALAPFVRDWSAFGRLDRREWLLIAAIAVFGMFGFSVLLVLGMRMVTGVMGSVVMATTPAVTAAAAVVFLGERLNLRKALSLALAVAGVLLLAVAGGGPAGDMPLRDADPVSAFVASLPSSTLLGMALVFGAVVSEAFYSLMGRQMSQETDPILVAFLAAILSLPLFLPFALIQTASFDAGETHATDWIAVVWYGAGTLGLGTWLWFTGISKAPASVAAAFMGLMPVSALVLSYGLLGEAFRWVHVAGFGIVFAGVLLMSVEHASHRAADDEEDAPQSA